MRKQKEKNVHAVNAKKEDENKISWLKNKINQHRIQNIQLHLNDFIAEGSGLPDHSIDYMMLLNFLHHEAPNQILSEVKRILKPGKSAGIIHCRSDIATPRGPRLEIRPTPEQCKKWAIESSFTISKELTLKPYHFGLIISKL